MAEWASNGLFGVPDYFGNCTAIGVTHKENLIAGVVYNDYRKKPDGTPHSIEMSIYSIDRRWATRQNLREFFAYPFIRLGLKRVQTICSAQEEGVILFNQRLGFIKEGTHRDAWHFGGDAISWSMLKDECPWL